jgi:hypothetical protein
MEELPSSTHYALVSKSVTATEQLLKQGATVNAVAQKYNEHTALHLAAYFWSAIPLKTFKDLLEKEKDKINVKDKYTVELPCIAQYYRNHRI